MNTSTFYITISLSLYLVTCIFYFMNILLTESFDDKKYYTVKNLLLILIWPFVKICAFFNNIIRL